MFVAVIKLYLPSRVSFVKPGGDGKAICVVERIHL